MDLVKAARKGNLEAFEELVARHRDKVYARAFSMMRNEEDAIDVSQEAWVKGWQRLKQFQGDSSFLTWMTRIAINLCLDALRKQKRQRAESIEGMEEETGGVERQIAGEAIVKASLVQINGAAPRRVPVKQADAAGVPFTDEGGVLT